MRIIINVDLPDDHDCGLTEYDLKMHLGVKLYEDGLVSSGFAARMLGMERRDFLENMGSYGGEIFKMGDEEEIKKECEIARQFAR